MQSEAPANHEPPRGLPPISPPSGKFIVQLFLVPSLIVAVAVFLVWGFNWLVGGSYTPDQFLKDLRSPNTEVRWRRASDLAQVLNRDKTLAANPGFGLDLAELLNQALRDNEDAERSWAEQTRNRLAKEPPDPPKPLQADRLFIQFLISSLGNFSVPVGVPLLNDIALKEDGADPATVMQRRYVALWALALLGEKLQHVNDMAADQQQVILAALEKESQHPSPERGRWAYVTQRHLQNRLAGRPGTMGVDKTMAHCGKSSDPVLRKFVALALTFWQGNPEENSLMEETLVELSRDQGQGAEPAEVRVRGLEIRYKATEALARRGSNKTAGRLAVLEEMLDEGRQESNFRTKLQDGRDVADEALIVSTIRGALRGLAELHRQLPELDLSQLHPAIDKLTQSSQREIKTEAERTLIALDRKRE